MKRLAITFGILCLGVFAMFIETDKKKKKKRKEERLVSVELAGPHGETVLTGSHGGKYYMKDDRKIYIRHKD